MIGFESTPEGETAVPRLLGELLGDLRVQDCLWVGLMEWDLRIENVALRPRFGAEGGTRPDGWVLCVGMGPGVRLEVTAGCQGVPVEEVRLIVSPGVAPELLHRTCWGRRRIRTVSVTEGPAGS